MMFSVIVWLWIVSIAITVSVPLVTFASNMVPNFVLTMVTYGKQRGNKTIIGDVPKRWFTHFYLWATVVDAAVLFQVLQYLVIGGHLGLPILADVLFLLTSVNVGKSDSARAEQVYFTVVQFEAVLALGLLLVQSVRRLYECVAVVVNSKHARMHFAHYVLGFVFYSLRAPLLVLHLQSNDGEDPTSTSSGVLSILKLHHILGLSIFFYGSYHQYTCHKILADLRGGSNSSSEDPSSLTRFEKYTIPYGDWFQYVSSPHYTAEIMIYVGVCVLMWGNIGVWLIPLFSFSCLSFSAYWTHSWYLGRFPQYKKMNRKILIPFVW